MRVRWVVLAGALGVLACPPPPPSNGDGGGGESAGGGTGGSGGGGGSVGDGGDDGAWRLDPSLFDAGWLDDGGILLGCEVDAVTEGVPADCAPSTSGCKTASDCASSLCLRLATGGVCTQPCTTRDDCDTGWKCQLRWTGGGQQGFCVPAGRVP